MPFYEYECLECRATFERLAKMSDPTPPCPVLVDQRDLNDEDFRVVSIKVREYLTEAKAKFEAGREVHIIGCHPRTAGPDYEFTVIHLVPDEDGECTIPETLPLGEWVEGMKPCGGETKKLISKSEFHLKGGGWAADGY